MNDNFMNEFITKLLLDQAQEIDNKILQILKQYPEYGLKDLILDWSTDGRPLTIRTVDNKILYEFPYAKEYYIKEPTV